MTLANISIYAHQFLELAAYATGFQLYLYLRRRWPRGPKLTAEQTAWIVIGVIFGALVGAKLLAWAESAPWYWQHRTDWRILIGGKTIVGAILGGWIGVELVKRSLGLSHPSGDIYVFPVILGMCIGRVGCFFAGLDDHTYGIATSLPWGVDFGDGVRRHPTQLYEIAFLIAVGGAFAWRLRTGRQRGCMFSQFVFAYMGWRLVVEFIKPRYTIPVVPLSAIQLTALGGMVYAIFHWNDNCCGRITAGTGCGSPSEDPIRPTNGHPERTREGSGRSEVEGIGLGVGSQIPRGYARNDCGCDGNCSPPTKLPAPASVELTNSLCPHCLAKIEARIIVDAGQVFLQKFCPEHGPQHVLIADDAAYWQTSRNLYGHPPAAPSQRHTPMQRGCPWDCGLCPDHEQHTCLAIVEITDRCDLNCPVCYASSAFTGQHRSLPEIQAMLDVVVTGQSRVGVVQLSGGEPTLHPDLFAAIDSARARPIRHLMLNTNGRRIAEDDAFVRHLATYRPGFEVYLQFDSLRSDTLRQLRGSDLSDIRRRAVEALNRHNISTTLVVTLKKGINDQEIGEILDFAIAQPCVRGITFQPIQAAGRLVGFDPAVHRLTLTEVRRAILSQHKLFTPQDIVPVPCHPDALAMAYAIRHGTNMTPLSKLLDPQSLLNMAGNTICFEQDSKLRQHVQQLLSNPSSTSSVARQLKLQCCLPLLPANGSPIAYDNVFRIIIMQFMDACSMDLRSLKRSCVHIVSPAGRLVPFETYNLLHRPGCQASNQTAHAVQ
ncbi:MAG: prolipoprotein diacylglyceryl transferase family protein [Tepidisphaeraceae bacterium]